MTSREKLFVAGLGRSGTGALAQLLSEHPDVAIGLERFKYFQRDPEWQITEEHFTKERFFDFTDGGTNISPLESERWAEYYAGLEGKWDSARYVGDKMTNFQLPRIWRNIPQSRYVCIVRDIKAVAASWSKRAHNPDDVNWPEERDAHAAVEAWNRSLTRLLDLKKRRPRRLQIVEHGRFFGDPDGRLVRDVCTWLDLPFTDDFAAAFQRSHEHYVGYVATKNRELTGDDEAFIAANADLEAWQAVLDTPIGPPPA